MSISKVARLSIAKTMKLIYVLHITSTSLQATQRVNSNSDGLYGSCWVFNKEGTTLTSRNDTAWSITTNEEVKRILDLIWMPTKEETIRYIQYISEDILSDDIEKLIEEFTYPKEIHLGEEFLRETQATRIEFPPLPRLTVIWDRVLLKAELLENINFLDLSQLIFIGDAFLYRAILLKTIELPPCPQLTTIGNGLLHYSKKLESAAFSSFS